MGKSKSEKKSQARGKIAKPQSSNSMTPKTPKQPKGLRDKLTVQLCKLGLRTVVIKGDGNCFFRAIADQLEGDQEKHAKYRQTVVEYIQNHPDDYQGFVYDESFEEHCEMMKMDGEWAGSIEVYAASLATHTNICIHSLRTQQEEGLHRNLLLEKTYIPNSGTVNPPTIHLSYHHGVHYNSVRLKRDKRIGPARPFIITNKKKKGKKTTRKNRKRWQVRRSVKEVEREEDCEEESQEMARQKISNKKKTTRKNPKRWQGRRIPSLC